MATSHQGKQEEPIDWVTICAPFAYFLPFSRALGLGAESAQLSVRWCKNLQPRSATNWLFACARAIFRDNASLHVYTYRPESPEVLIQLIIFRSQQGSVHLRGHNSPYKTSQESTKRSVTLFGTFLPCKACRLAWSENVSAGCLLRCCFVLRGVQHGLLCACSRPIFERVLTLHVPPSRSLSPLKRPS